MRRIFLILATLCVASVSAQRLDPAQYIYPIEGVDGTCSAGFGEMRPAHFHGGVDIRTGGTEGKTLVAVADGYISRVAVAPGGYGRAIYLTLNNGTTAVYGHLRRYTPDMEAYLLQERYNRRTNNLDLYFEPDRWPVHQGDVVGYSGNSGSSMGPHLHFEIRDTPTQALYNPVLEGLVEVADTVPPRFMKLHYVEVDTLDGVCHRAPMRSYGVVRGANGKYRLTREEPLSVGRKGYFIAEVTDRRNGVHNTFGVWRLSAELDDECYFEYQLNGFSFDQSRLCDVVSCYALQITSRNECLQVAQQSGAPNDFYPTMRERGLVRTEPGQVRRVRLEVEDDCHNRSELSFEIQGVERTFRAEVDPEKAVLRPGQALRYGADSAYVEVRGQGLYEALVCSPRQVTLPQQVRGVVALTPAYEVIPRLTPLRENCDVAFHAAVPQAWRLKASIGAVNAKGRVIALGGAYVDGAVRTKTRTAGAYFIAVDTLPPTVTPLFQSGADLTGQRLLRFRLGDNFSGVASAVLTIDDEWVAFDRYPMQGTLVHRFEQEATRSRHRVRLVVTDDSGNTTTWNGTFLR